MPLSAEGLDEVMASARRRAGLVHATCHELRHTCLTRLREEGMSLEALQAQADHLSIASPQVYLHLGSDWLAAGLDGVVGTLILAASHLTGPRAVGAQSALA